MKPICNAQLGGGFDEWFVDNYASIKESLSLRGLLDEDCLHDTYLYIIRTDGGKLSYKEYRRQFMKDYSMLRRKHVSRSFQYVYPDPLFFGFLHDDEEIENAPSQKDFHPSFQRVMQYIKLHTKPLEYKMFTLRVVQNMSYSFIADYVGDNPTSIRKHIDSIMQDVQNYFRKHETNRLRHIKH